MTEKVKLIEHRRVLSKNSRAYSYEIGDQNIERLVKSLIPHLKWSGYQVSFNRSFDTLSRARGIRIQLRPCCLANEPIRGVQNPGSLQSTLRKDLFQQSRRFIVLCGKIKPDKSRTVTLCRQTRCQRLQVATPACRHEDADLFRHVKREMRIHRA